MSFQDRVNPFARYWYVYFCEPEPGGGSRLLLAFITKADAQDEIYELLPSVPGRTVEETWYPRRVEVAPFVPFEDVKAESLEWLTSCQCKRGWAYRSACPDHKPERK